MSHEVASMRLVSPENRKSASKRAALSPWFHPGSKPLNIVSEPLLSALWPEVSAATRPLGRTAHQQAACIGCDTRGSTCFQLQPYCLSHCVCMQLALHPFRSRQRGFQGLGPRASLLRLSVWAAAAFRGVRQPDTHTCHLTSAHTASGCQLLADTKRSQPVESEVRPC